MLCLAARLLYLLFVDRKVCIKRMRCEMLLAKRCRIYLGMAPVVKLSEAPGVNTNIPSSSIAISVLEDIAYRLFLRMVFFTALGDLRDECTSSFYERKLPRGDVWPVS